MKRMIPGIAGLALLMLCWQGAHAGLRQLRREAQGGAPNAELKLGELYQYGVGEPDHLVRALAWYDRAAPRSPRAAELARKVAAELTPAERQQAAAWAKPRIGPP
ncbi:SEL1-like repeat protein [Acidiferrobacter sp.]|uniref:SEL1-like repeat protein n=1 Tax=Acidiferrobacter sp. TaxID=1872107 RepID=UPI00262B69F9|nr:SEL1-like repeat protein [Acidiferrobacter sp.]